MTNTNSFLNDLNPQQREAATHTDGPLLILAGAGSGKTRVLTYRTAYLIEQGVMPWEILAITFTNKASDEMRERVDRLLGGRGASVFVSTFHKLCVRILRRDAEQAGFARDFTIYDADDQRTLMKQVIRDLNLDSKMYREKTVLSVVSSCKNAMRTAEDYAAEASDFYEKGIAKAFAEYEKRLKKNNAMDFDDLLFKTVQLFQTSPDILAGYQERFRYIMVDEYQDTNAVQFELVRLLSARYRNLCVVGDDDQSIYRFRGADIHNILSFEQSFPGARVIKLEQNYRSTGAILAAANDVIRNNKGRKSKKLWTENADGGKPIFTEYETAAAEAEAVIREASVSAYPLREQAVLYRTNAQSRLFEEQCLHQNVPYVIVGGVNFYQRREIKDILSYLRVMANDVDDLACERIINVPKRGIGQTTLERVRAYAVSQGIGVYEALLRAERIPDIGTALRKLQGFTELISSLRTKAADPQMSLKNLVLSVRDDTGYADELKKEGEVEAQTRMENIDELVSKAASYELSLPAGEEIGRGTDRLGAFLEEVSLLSDLDRTNDGGDVLTMMTLHAAKGLEFRKVYLCGMEEGLFPSSLSINSDHPQEEVEEERRLCYVGITRAQRELRLTAAGTRMINGETRYEKPSRFIDEISDNLCDKTFLRRRAASWEDEDDDFERPIPRRGFQGSFSGRQTGGFFSQGRQNAYSAYADLLGKRKTPSTGEGTVGDNALFFRPGVVGSFGSLDHSRTGASAYGRKRTASSQTSMPKTGAAFVKQRPDYDKGDRVTHIKFGAGTVLSVTEGAKDYEVTVDFDEAGQKRMFAGFARLKKL